jgi:hypothetical protein
MKSPEPNQRQFTLRTIFLAAAVLPPLVGGFCGALGPYIQLWLLLAFGIPALALALLGLTFALGYVLFVVPVVAVSQAVERAMDRFLGAGK